MRNVLISLAGVLCTACAANQERGAAAPSAPLARRSGTQLAGGHGPPLPPQASSGDYCLEANGGNVIGRWICCAVDHPTFWRWTMTAGFTAIGFAVYHSIRASSGCPLANVTVTYEADPITGNTSNVAQYHCR
jgi:hypothetical protein